MQCRSSSEAPAQKPSLTPEAWDADQAHPAEESQVQSAQSNSWFERTLAHLTEIVALSGSAKQLYVAQVKLTGELAKAEWQLTERSLAMAAILMVCFGAGIIFLWGTLLLLLGAVLTQLGNSLAVTTTVLLLLQLALLFWCWRSLSYVLSQIGFAKTRQQLRRLFLTKPEQNDVN